MESSSSSASTSARPQSPSTWRGEDDLPRKARTFLLNHADGIASIDLFVVPTISFKLVYGLLILRHDRRRIVWVSVTTSPTSEWIARQVREACGWEPVPDYLVRDRDRVYGQAFARRLRAMAFATDRQRRDRRGRTVTLND